MYSNYQIFDGFFAALGSARDSTRGVMKRGPPARDAAAEEGMFSWRNELAQQWANLIGYIVGKNGAKTCASFCQCSCVNVEGELFPRTRAFTTK